jgi:hypothetical protein
MHVDSGTLQALLDDEVGAQDRMSVQAHLVSCTECAAELDEMRQFAAEAHSAFAILDGYAPMLEGRIRVDPAVRLTEKRRFSRLLPASLARAAALVLLVAGAASAAIPGSPVRRFASDLVERASRILAANETPEAVQVEEPSTVPVEIARDTTGGQAVSLADGAVRIEVYSATPGASIRVRLVNDREAWVKTFGTPARYRSGNGWMNVYDLDEEGAVVDLPRGARVASVAVNGNLFYVYENGVGRVIGQAAETFTDGALFRAR